MARGLKRPRLVDAKVYNRFKEWCKLNHIPLKDGLELAMDELRRHKAQRRLNEFDEHE
ncbi:MAG: hypothetical protein ACXQS2_00790 [Methermicoccaceae archaeon]